MQVLSLSFEFEIYSGGLLIGATINMFPELFKAAVADVPFVDVVNTMSDPTIPLTVVELTLYFHLINL